MDAFPIIQYPSVSVRIRGIGRGWWMLTDKWRMEKYLSARNSLIIKKLWLLSDGWWMFLIEVLDTNQLWSEFIFWFLYKVSEWACHLGGMNLSFGRNEVVKTVEWGDHLGGMTGSFHAFLLIGIFFILDENNFICPISSAMTDAKNLEFVVFYMFLDNWIDIPLDLCLLLYIFLKVLWKSCVRTQKNVYLCIGFEKILFFHDKV